MAHSNIIRTCSSEGCRRLIDEELVKMGVRYCCKSCEQSGGVKHGKACSKNFQKQLDEEDEGAKIEAGIQERLESKKRVAAQTEKQRERNAALAAAKQAEEGRKEEWRGLETTLKIDSSNKMKDTGRGLIMGLVDMMFLLVLVGCEVDLYGFMMAFNDYWSMDQLIVKVLLILCPLGYLLACIMYYWIKADMTHYLFSGDSSAPKTTEEPAAPKMTADGKLPQKPIDMKVYHFLPVIRYYVVVKERETDDVEALFRVNSLSSFSLGLAQIVGILFQVFVAELPMTIFIWINVASQCVNWTITFMYFLTPLSNYMQSLVKVNNMTNYTSNRLKEIHTRYLQTVNQVAEAKTSEEKREANTARSQVEGAVDQEILALAKQEDQELDLDAFKFEDKISALKLMHKKQALAHVAL